MCSHSVIPRLNAREGLRLALRKTDYVLRFASGAEDALEQLRREPVDIVVSDHAMPGVTGLELLKIVHVRHPAVVRKPAEQTRRR